MGIAVNRINPDIWSILKNSQPSGDNLNARLPFPLLIQNFYCALDVNGVRHLLLKLADDDLDFRDSQSRGLTISSRELALADNIPCRYLDIECKDTSGYSALDLIGGEIVDEMLNSQKKPIDIVKNVLLKWRRFWGQFPQHILSREAQIGLFAELWFINVWLFNHYGSKSILFWRGPWGTRHDFEWENRSVEVKATTLSSGRIFTIHGIDQLEPPSGGPLYLFGMSLREESGSTNSLSELVKIIKYSISDDAEASSRFETGLFQIGYSPIHEEEYSKLHLRVIEETLFFVKDDFPRIIRKSFQNGIPAGIEWIEYSINLSGYSHLIVAATPDCLPF